MEANNKNIVIQYQMAVSELLQNGNSEAFKAFLHDDIAWHLPKAMIKFGNNLYNGIDGIEKMLTEGVRIFYQPESIQTDFRSMIAEGNLVHIHFGMQAKTTMGKPYENDYQVLYELKDGKIINVWEYFDSYILIEAMTS